MRISKLALLMVLAACSRPSSDFGISSQNPLGTVDKIDKFLQGTNIIKKPVTDAEGNLKEHYLDDPKSYPDGGISWNASFFADAQGRIARMEGRFREKRNRMSILTGIFEDYWKNLSGGDPKFQTLARISSAQPSATASFSKGAVEGKWTQWETEDSAVEHKIELKLK